MIVAQREYSEQLKPAIDIKENHQIQKKKEKKFKAIQKSQMIFTLIIIGSLCIGILFGYVKLTELRYRINQLDKEINQLQANVENLKVEVEKVKRSDIIELKAKEELGMQYPTKDQMVFLNVDTKNLVNVSNTQLYGETSQNILMDNVKGKLYKILTLLD